MFKAYKKQNTTYTTKSTKKLEILQKTIKFDCHAKSNALSFLKDHKPNFSTIPKCHLINPAKCEIGKISRIFLEHVNSKVKDLLLTNQSLETSTVINCLKNINNKSKCIFVQFAIEKSYLLQFQRNFY